MSTAKNADSMESQQEQSPRKTCFEKGSYCCYANIHLIHYQKPKNKVYTTTCINCGNISKEFINEI